MSLKSDVEKLAAAQKKSLLAQLAAQRDASISNLEAERAKIAPAYQQAQNQAAAQSALSAKNFAEYMAGRGLSAGTGAQFNIMNMAGLQGTLGALGQQRAMDLSDIERRRTGVLNQYEAGVAAGTADIEAAMLERLLNLRHRGGGGGGGGGIGAGGGGGLDVANLSLQELQTMLNNPPPEGWSQEDRNILLAQIRLKSSRALQQSNPYSEANLASLARRYGMDWYRMSDSEKYAFSQKVAQGLYR